MARILVIGSVALDHVVFLKESLREGAHLEGEDRGVRLGGGAGNTGGALAHAGHVVLPVAPIGSDQDGQRLEAAMAEIGLDLSLVLRVEGASTRSIVMVDGQGERTIVNLSRAGEPSPPTRLLDVEADALFVRSRALDLSPILRRKAEDALVVAHLPPLGAGVRPAQVLVASQSDLSPQDMADPWALGCAAAGEGLLRWVVITKGADGAVAYGRRGQVIFAPAPVVTPKDTTGAGDAFAAGLVHALISGHEMEEALHLACAWGAEATQWETSLLPRAAVNRLCGGDKSLGK